jgi:hypothetical protein
VFKKWFMPVPNHTALGGCVRQKLWVIEYAEDHLEQR